MQRFTEGLHDFEHSGFRPRGRDRREEGRQFGLAGRYRP